MSATTGRGHEAQKEADISENERPMGHAEIVLLIM